MPSRSALAPARKAGIVHRDLKPDNILLTNEGSVKVLDFGLAKLHHQVETDTPTRTAETMTRPGAIAGTGPYMSPEQAQGDAVDARSDIFSFGAVLYELLSGRRAFGRETLTATLAAAIAQEPPPLQEARPEVARIVRKMLAKPREARYPSAEALLADLHAAAAGAGLAARRRWLAGAAALVMVIAVVAGSDVRGWRTRLIDWMRAPAPSMRLAVLPFANLTRAAAAGSAPSTAPFALGLRIGEGLGLLWEDVDLDRATVFVRRALQRVPLDGGQSELRLVEPKSETSIRVVTVPASGVRIVVRHRASQTRERLVAGSRWVPKGLVFTTTIGTPLDERNVRRELYTLMAEAGLPRLRLHDLRHGDATFLLAAGEHPKVVQEMLGHASVQLTLDTFSQSIKSCATMTLGGGRSDGRHHPAGCAVA
jgi:integrase